MKVSKLGTISFVLLMVFAFTAKESRAQFTVQWLDIGDMHSIYIESGAMHEQALNNRGMQWPAIQRESGHTRAEYLWIGHKDWTGPNGTQYPDFSSRLGPRVPGAEFVTPMQNKLISKWEDTEVTVDGLSTFDKVAIVDEIDPNLPSDRMIHNIARFASGVEMERKIYAYSNEWNDDFHIIDRVFTNTGNVDEDDEIELDGQTLNETAFFNGWRWTGRSQAAWTGSAAQAWGKFSMVDVVGDGHEDYPVDFTAIYLWAGFDPDFASGNWDHLGSPMINSNNWTTARDTTGRLAGQSMSGLMVLHADNSTSDRSYDPAQQPLTLGYMDSDEALTADGQPLRDYYELGILTRENPTEFAGGDSRMFPHYADRIEPDGKFWEPTNDASTGKQGGHAATIAYGPYDMAFGESIRTVEAVVAYGLSYDAAKYIGEYWNANGRAEDLIIEYDANGDGVIDTTPFDYTAYNTGGEALTKNQWFMTARDSMFSKMYQARRVWEASNDMSVYPVVEPPRPPRTFDVQGLPDRIALTWETHAGASDPEAWEVYRTGDFYDNLPYEKVTTLPGSARSFDDSDGLLRGVDYYYYLTAVGGSNAVDPNGITGTPGGMPLRSSRYFTQTYSPTTLKRAPGQDVADFAIVPNPINLGSDESVRIFVEGDATRLGVLFLDIPGDCTITIYTETGEFVKQIIHNDQSGDESWNLTTDARQLIVSGIYLVRVEDNETGEVDTKKLVVIK